MNVISTLLHFFDWNQKIYLRPIMRPRDRVSSIQDLNCVCLSAETSWRCSIDAKAVLNTGQRRYERCAMILTRIARYSPSQANRIFMTFRYNDEVFNPRGITGMILLLVISRYISSSVRTTRAFTLGEHARLMRTMRQGSKRIRGVAGRMKTPACVHINMSGSHYANF